MARPVIVDDDARVVALRPTRTCVAASRVEAEGDVMMAPTGEGLAS
jgi:hypothetical protein